MVTALQNTYLSWDITSPKKYTAGNVLALTLTFTAPEKGNYYLLGALYDSEGNYISGTLFGVLVPEGSDYAINNAQHSSLWELEEDEETELPCQFILDRSNVVLGLFLMEMAGDEPSLENDEEIDSLSVVLNSPAAEVDIGQLMMMAMAIMMLGMVMATAFKE